MLPIVNTKPDAELIADLDAAEQWAKKEGGDAGRLGIIGFCRGGRTGWIYGAHSGDLKAGVAFYGPLVDPPSQKSLWPKSATELAPQMQAPVLGLYGEADQGIPLAQVEAMKAALQAAASGPNSRSTPAPRTAFMRITGRATARRPLMMLGTA